MAGLQQVGGNYERRRTVVLAVLISGLLSAFSLPGASSDNPHRVRLQLKWYHQFQFAGYYAAEEEGYYAQEELEVSFIEGDPSHPPIGEVLAGRAEFGVSDADLLKAYIEGKPVVALASIFQHSPYILIARADSGIRTPGDLKGKVIMLDKEQGFVQLKAILQREGIPMDSLNIVPHQWSIDPLIQRKVDVLSAYSTAEPFHLKAKGVEPAAIRAMDYGVDFYGDTLFTTREQIRRHPDTVAAFRRASLRGWKYALDHPDEIIDLILAMPNVERRGITREMLQLEEKAMRDLVLPDVVEIGHMNLGRWEAMSRTYANAGLIRRTPTQAELQGFIYIHPKTTGEHWVAPLLLGLAMLGAVAAGALLWSIQLRRAVRKRTTALQEAEQRLKYHVQNSPLAVIEWDAQFRVARWTGQAEQVFGWKAEEVLGKHPRDWRIVHEQDMPAVEARMSRLVSGKEPRSFSANRNYHKNGSIIDCEWYNSGAFDSSGRMKSILSLVLDITARKRAEQALRESEERMRLFLERAPVSLAIFDREMRYLAASDRWVRDYDLKGDPIGRRHYDVFPDLPEKWKQAHKKALAGDVVAADEDIYQQPDGTIRWVKWESMPWHTEGSEVGGIMVVTEDITARKKAEEAVRDARDLLAAIMEGTSDLIAALDPEFRYLAFNHAYQKEFQQIFGREPKVGGRLADALPKGKEHCLESWERALRGEQFTEVMEFEGLHGSRKFFEFRCGPIRNLSGEVVGAAHFGRDVSDRKGWEEALKASEERLSLVVEASNVGIWDWDLIAGKLDWSDQSLALFGLSPGTQMTYETFLKTVHPEDRERVALAVRGALDRREYYHAEMRAIWPDGSLHWIAARGRAYYNQSGKPIRMSGVALDITESKNVENALRQMRDQLLSVNLDLEHKVRERTIRLEETIGELEGFSYSLVHDLRAPLRAMQTFASILEYETAPQLAPALGDYLRRIKQAANRMDQLITDSLNYSKVVREELRSTSVHLGALLRGLIESYPNLHTNDAEIKLELGDLMVHGNEAGLVQVFSNLLGNAVKFVAPGIRPRIRIWSKARPPDSVEVCVEDNGIGIPKDAREKIFGMFQRLHRSEEYPGTGIGLAIVRKSLERMGGRIRVESESGKGSRFFAELPLARSAQEVVAHAGP